MDAEPSTYEFANIVHQSSAEADRCKLVSCKLVGQLTLEETVEIENTLRSDVHIKGFENVKRLLSGLLIG